MTWHLILTIFYGEFAATVLGIVSLGAALAFYEDEKPKPITLLISVALFQLALFVAFLAGRGL